MRPVMQLVLDLFGVTPAPRPTANVTSAAPPDTVAVDPPPQEVTPSVFQHPQARRRIRLGHTDVAYAFERSRRRTIGMAVGPQGLEVRAPRWVGWAEIEAALHEKADWIVRKLHEAQAQHAQQAQARIVWRDGAVIDYLGAPLQLVWADPAPTEGRVAARAVLCPAEPGVSPARLALPRTLASPQANPSDALRDAVQHWMRGQARVHFQARLDHFAPQLAVQWDRLALSGATTRWGSAGRDRQGRAVIRLHWRLMQHAPAVIDYVVVHELSHLRVMDHSPRFWDTVASVLPDHAARRRQLRDQPLPPWV